MLSREAEALYWMGRYLERAEATARRFDVEYHSRLEAGSPRSATLPWHALLFSLGDEAAYRKRYGDEEERSLLTFLILDDGNPNSIRACVRAARENAQRIRNQISSEMWEYVNRFYLELGEQTLETVLSRTPYGLLQWVKGSCWLLDGIAERTMLRGEGWQFSQCGKFLERAESTARLLDGKFYAIVETDAGIADVVDLHQWTALLKSAGAYEAFQKSYQTITPANIVEFVMLGAQFPGAIHYAVARVDASLRAISHPGAWERGEAAAMEHGNEAERCAGRLLASLAHARAAEVMAADLHTSLTGLVGECGTLHHAIVGAFFSHLAWRPWEADEPDPGADFTIPGEWHTLSSAP